LGYNSTKQLYKLVTRNLPRRCDAELLDISFKLCDSPHFIVCEKIILWKKSNISGDTYTRSNCGGRGGFYNCEVFVREHGVHAGPKDYFVVVVVVICGSI
jgi:hypothetical protein